MLPAIDEEAESVPAAVPATEPVTGPPTWLDMLPVLLVAALALLGLVLVSALPGEPG